MSVRHRELMDSLHDAAYVYKNEAQYDDHPLSRAWHRQTVSRMDMYNGVPYWERHRLALLYALCTKNRRSYDRHTQSSGR